MSAQKILVPYNFTNEDRKALDFVVSMFGPGKDVEITLFNSYIPVPEIEMYGAPIMTKLRDNLRYLSQKVTEQEGGLKKARRYLLDQGFSEQQVRHVFKPKIKDTAGEIIDLAKKEVFDVVVLSHKPGGVTRFLTGSTFGKVVNGLRKKTVCIIT